MSNIWTAASEGDLLRVVQLLDSGISPSAPDENTYTPLHAAASWSHPEILRILVQRGGDINIVDSDGETPLFVVETAEMARIIIELGGDATKVNGEGITAAQNLTEDYPHIALYLRSITGEAQPLVVTQTETSETTQPDLDTPTSDLLLQVKEIMEASERGELSSIEVDEKLREIVESVVSGTVQVGREIGESELDENGNYTSGTRDREPRDQGLEEVKRRREDAGR